MNCCSITLSGKLPIIDFSYLVLQNFHYLAGLPGDWSGRQYMIFHLTVHGFSGERAFVCNTLKK